MSGIRDVWDSRLPDSRRRGGEGLDLYFVKRALRRLKVIIIITLSVQVSTS